MTSEPNIVQNPSFAEGFSGPWRFVTREVGSGGHIVVNENALLFSASGIEKNGTLYAMQSVAKPDSGPLILSYRAASEGRDSIFVVFVLRERDARGQNIDSTFRHLLNRDMDYYEWTWFPKVAGGEVQLLARVSAKVGLEQVARMDDIELRAGPDVQWAVDGGQVLSSGGLLAKVVFDELGAHSVHAIASRLGEEQWAANTTVHVDNAVPQASLRHLPLTTPLAQTLWLDASDTVDADSSLQLVDPGFQQLGAEWIASTETGGKLSVSKRIDALGRAALDLTLAGATKNGTVTVSQVIPINRLEPAAFSVGIQDDGAIAGYQFILRERNATGAITDTAFSFGKTSGAERPASMVWQHKRTDTVSLQVFLRFRMIQGGSAHVTFTEPRLQSGLTYSYFLDDNLLGKTNNATWPLVLADTKPHEARVEVTDPDGAVATANLTLRANDGGHEWNLRGPRVIPLSPKPLFDASATRRADSSLNGIENPSFDQGKEGWTLGRGETGGSVTWDVGQDRDGRYARIEVHEDKGGSTYLSQVVDRRCLAAECQFSFSARLVSGAATLEPILRATVQPPGEAARNVDLRYSPVLGPQWSYNETSWSPPKEDVVRMQVFLRFRTPANGSATVDFRDVRLGPARSFSWDVVGPSDAREYRGPLIQPEFAAEGRHSVHVALETDLGLGTSFRSSNSTTVDVLPVSFFQTQDGLGLRVHGSRDGAAVSLLHADGAVAWSRAVDNALRQDPAREYLEAGDPMVLLPGSLASDRVALWNGTSWGNVSVEDLAGRLPDPFGPAEASTRHSGWTTRLHVTAPVADPSIQRATLVVRSGGAILDEVVVEPGPDGIDVLLDLPAGWRTRDLVVSIATEDGWGRTFTDATPVESGRNPVLLPSVLAIGVAAALVLFGVVVRLAQGRRP